MIKLIDDFALMAGGHLWNIVIYLGIIVAVYVGIRSRLVQFKMFPEAIRQVKQIVKAGKAENGITGVQALLVTIGGCIGTGNVAGVAMAIIVGGPGVIPWMWLIALLGAGTSFMENTLAQTYKIKEGSEFRGGPAYYMWKGLKQRWLGTFYAFVMIVSLGFFLVGLQTSSIALSSQSAFSIPAWVISLIVAVLIGLIIFGGVKRIATVAEKGVPLMTIIYLAMLVIIMAINFKEIPSAFGLIFSQAVTMKAVNGAALGTVIIQGFKRGIFSSGAGHGDAPTTGAASDVSHPAKQGMLGTLAIYVDTIIVCTATGLAIVFAQVYMGTEYVGIELSQYAFVHELGHWAGVVFAVCMMMFCFTSIMANYYCGETCLAYLSNGTRGRNIYRILFIISVFLGGVIDVAVIWDVADMGLAVMIITNMIAVLLLTPKAITVINDFIAQKKEGKDPVFDPARIGLENTECWPPRAIEK